MDDFCWHLILKYKVLTCLKLGQKVWGRVKEEKVIFILEMAKGETYVFKIKFL